MGLWVPASLPSLWWVLFYLQSRNMSAIMAACHPSDVGGGVVSVLCGSPQGVKLLSYLYNEAQNNCSNENYPVLLSLLKSSCEPYTRSVSTVRQIRLENKWLEPKVGTLPYAELTVWTECVCSPPVLYSGLCLTGCTAACLEMFIGSSWSRSMRSISAVEVRSHTDTHSHTRAQAVM